MSTRGTTDRTRAERALAGLIHELRPDQWDEHGILVTLRKVSERPLPDVAAAAIYCAIHRTDQHTPACIALDGEHWQAADRMAGQHTNQPARPPYLAGDRCPTHNQWTPCLTCQRIAAGPPATAEQIRAIRQAAQQPMTTTGEEPTP